MNSKQGRVYRARQIPLLPAHLANRCYPSPHGEPCKGIPVDDSDYCYAHHPDHAEERRRYGSRGGKRAGRGRPQADARDVKKRLLTLADDVLAGSVEKGRGAVVSQILGTYLRALDIELKATEQLELVQRIEAIEQAAEARSERTERWSA
jgi:hypothetical protein